MNVGGRVNHVRVRTAEGVVFSFPLAGPVTRMLAAIVDLMIVSVAGSILGRLLTLVQIVNRDWAAALSVIAFFVASIGYGIVLEWLWRGQTIGKRLMRLRVVDTGGLSLTFSQVMLRNLIRPLDQFPAFYLVGVVAMMLNRRAQRLGDLAADTMVIRHRRILEPDLEQLWQPRHNSLADIPHLAARLRQRVPPVLAAAAVEALLRREALDPEARVALFAELAGSFRALVPYPSETVRALPDEAYVRDVVEIVHSHAQRIASSAAPLASVSG